MSGHVFISYARKDGESYAIQFEELLPQHGFVTWRDKRGINPAQDFTAEIERAIEEASCVVTCITPDVRRGDSFVRREIVYAQVLNKPVIVARFADMTPPISVITNAWLDFFKDWDAAFETLREWLLEPPAPGDSRALPPDDPRSLAGQESIPADPFRDYLSTLYKYITRTLDQLVIAHIDLHAQDTPDAVAKPAPPRMRQVFSQRLGLDTGSSGKPKHFDSFNDVIDHYEGRLLLLGEPGAGKTITLLTHTRDAIAVRLEDMSRPLPLLGAVATWDSDARTPIADWLAAGWDLAPKDVAKVIKSGHALLLLDGLDELGTDRPADPKNPDGDKYDPRPRFIETVNASVAGEQTGPGHNRLVVTCRVRDYADIGVKVTLPGAVTLQPLIDNQIAAYLTELPALWQAVAGDQQLRNMLRTPLVLSLFSFAYRNIDAAEASQLRDLSRNPSDLRDAIIDRYVDERYAWEARRLLRPNSALPFTLETMRTVLGRIAMEDAGMPWKKGIVLEDFTKILPEDEIHPFIEQAIQLNILTFGKEDSFRFIHLLVRDRFATTGANNALAQGNAYERYHAAEALGRIGDLRAVPVLVETLGGDDDERVRRSAADALGRLGDTQAVDPLLTALNDDNSPVVRRRAALALGRLGDDRALRALLDALSDSDVYVRGSACTALGEIGDARAVNPLLAMLADQTNLVRGQAVDALASMGSTAITDLISALKDGRANVRRSVADVLGRIGDQRATDTLAQALTDRNKSVRNHVAKALVRLGAASTDLWLKALDDEDADIRCRAASALGQLGDKRAVHRLIATLQDENEHVRYRAASALGQIGDIRAVDPLIVALDDTARVRERASKALRHIGTPEALAALEKWQRDQQDSME